MAQLKFTKTKFYCMFKEASEGVDRPTQGNSDFVVIFFFIFETRVLLKEVEECLPLIGRTRWRRQ